MTRERDAVVTATFHDKDQVVDAIEGLATHAVPAKNVEVVLVDETGIENRGGPGLTEGAVLRGLGIGAAIGAAIGGPAFALLSAGVVGLATPDWLSSDVTAAILQGIFLSGALGGAFGAVLGRLSASGRRSVEVSTEEVDRGAVLVSVRGDTLASTARRVLADAGADHVSE